MTRANEFLDDKITLEFVATWPRFRAAEFLEKLWTHFLPLRLRVAGYVSAMQLLNCCGCETNGGIIVLLFLARAPVAHEPCQTTEATRSLVNCCAQCVLPCVGERWGQFKKKEKKEKDASVPYQNSKNGIFRPRC